MALWASRALLRTHGASAELVHSASGACFRLTAPP